MNKLLNIWNTGVLVIVMAGIGFTGCRKFLDTNENPNLSSEASIELLLPAVQAAIGHVLGNPLQIYGGIWGQYWAQSPKSSQYRSLEQYSVTTTSFDRPWRMFYSDALQDLEEIFMLTEGQPGTDQYQAIAYILKAYALQVATDAWGDIPMTEANTEGNTSPAYNSQEQVYDSIVALVNKGLSLLDVNAEVTPGTDDLLFGGDMEQWLRFANTFKLRVFLRMSEVAPQKAEAGLQSMSGEDFLEEDAQIEYSTTGGNQNPLFSEILGLSRVQNLVASETSTKFLTQNGDPRADVFYQRYVTADMDTIVGIPQGSYRTNTNEFSLPSAAVGAAGQDNNSANAPVKFMSAAESYFLQAEAVTRGWMTSPMTAQQLFEEGIRASFESYDVEGVEDYIATSPAAQWPAGEEARIKAIITQKWAAMNGNQSFEGWTEWRRTGYPDFFTVSQATALGDDRMPARILYPSSEVTRNLNFPGIKQVFEPVWWDVK
jgi:hypothetical protein